MPTREIGGQIGKADFREPLQQQRLRLGKRAFERGIHRLLDQTLWCFVAIAYGKHGRLAQRLVQLAQVDGAKVGMDAPSTRVASI